MKIRKTYIVFFSILIILIVLLSVLVIYSNQTPKNPAGTVGNTAGNLNNSGLVCENNGKVYFANPFDGHSLYIMNSDESGLTKLNSLKVHNLLVDGAYIYFYQKGSTSTSAYTGLMAALPNIPSFTRCNLNGTQSTVLTKDNILQAQLVDSYLYLLALDSSGYSFYKTNLNGEEKSILADYEINPSCANNGIIYYNGTQNNHYLYALNSTTDISETVWKGNIWYPTIEGDYMYYLNVSGNYELCRYSLIEHVVEILTHDRVDCFNVGNGFIYYQKNSATNPQLICMHTDGSNKQIIAEGNYTAINMTSQYVYFQGFGDTKSLYHSPLGSGNYERFYAAENIVNHTER